MSKHTGLEEFSPTPTHGSKGGMEAFKGWQSHAYNAFDSLAEKLLNDLDAIVSEAATDESLSFAQKLTLLANYVGHGQLLRAFPFLDQNQYQKWLDGTEEPRAEMQAAIIQLCQAEIASAFHEGSSFVRVLNYLPSTEKLSPVVLPSVNANQDALLFDPWQKIDYEALSTRIVNGFKNECLYCIGQLVVMDSSDFDAIPGIGKLSIQEIKVYLESQGAALGMNHLSLQEFKSVNRLLELCAHWISGNRVLPGSHQNGCFHPLGNSYQNKLHDAGLTTIGKVALAKRAEVEALLNHDAEAIKLVESKLTIFNLELGMTLDPRLIALLPKGVID